MTVKQPGPEIDLVEMEEKAAMPLELFFDLVFVFAITQIVSLVVDDLTWSGIFHGALILALLWWAWGNWTWATNATDLEPRLRRLLVMAAMVGVFVIAHAVPTAFESDGRWVAWGYAYVRFLALTMLFISTVADGVRAKAFWTYSPPSLIGPVLAIIGAYQGESQQWWWLAAVGAEVLSAELAGRADWTIDAAHFAERHGLIMIIALGESIVVVGSVLVGKPVSEVWVLLAVGLAGVCAMWWAYFDRLQLAWEHDLREADVHQTGHLARDVYSLLHYPMIAGIVLYAVALEEVFIHPGDPLPTTVGWILIGAVALYLLSIAIATYRSRREYLWERVICVGLVAAIVLGTDFSGKTVVIITTALLVATMGAEYTRFTRRYRRRQTVQESAVSTSGPTGHD